MKYNAFISYRHSPLDMEIAKKVHTGLETYRIPKSVQKKLGIKKIKRVFRDQEELPIGSNLSDNIGEALKESEHLIVICSPRTPESEWVQKEIETFIKLHGRENVLAVLIEGEPNESFPELLLNDENGNPVEPLAADVRGETAKERNKKFKTEILRLVAPVIGCSYDDLRQRHRERVVKRTVSLVSAAAGIIAVAGIAFGLYHADVATKMTNLANEKAQLAEEKTQLADEKTQLADEILQEYRLKQENQSRFLAKEALSLYAEGEREDAALIAMAALPGEGNDRPYVAEAEYALGNILHVYDTGKYMSFDRTLSHDLIINDEKLSTDKTRLVTRDNGSTVYVWDTETWELVTRIAPGVNDNNYLERVIDAFADETGVYTLCEHSFTKYDFEAKKVYDYTTDLYLTNAEICPSKNSAYLLSGNVIVTVDLTKGTKVSSVEMPEEGRFSTRHSLSTDETYLIASYYKSEVERIDILAYNVDKNICKTTRLSEDDILDYCYTPLGNLAVLTCNSDFITAGVKNIYLDLVNPQTGNIIWSREIPATVNYLATFCVDIKAHSYDYEDGTTLSEIVLAVEDEAFTVNELNSKIVTSMTLSGNMETLDLRSDNQIGFISYDNGNIDTVDFHEGRVYSDNVITTDKRILDLVIMNGKVAILPIRSSTIYVMKYNMGEDIKEIATAGYYTSLISNPNGADHFMFRSEDGLYKVLSKDGDELAKININSSYATLAGFLGDTAIIFSYDTIYFADVKTGKVDEVPYSKFDIDNKFFNGYITDNGKYALMRDYRELLVIDLENRTVLFYESTSEMIESAVLSEDGSTMLVVSNGLNLLKIDVATKEVTEYDNENLRALSDISDLRFLSISPDGKTAAMYCMDGKVHILNVSDGSTIDEIPFNAKGHCSLYFTTDSKNLIMQGDDFTVKIRDIAAKTYINSFNTAYEITQPIQSGDGYIGICDIANFYLVETEHYGICAQVTEGASYIPSDRSFIISSSSHLYHVPFKDYKALIEEAKKQFPGAELTAEEKVKYNLN